MGLLYAAFPPFISVSMLVKIILRKASSVVFSSAKKVVSFAGHKRILAGRSEEGRWVSNKEKNRIGKQSNLARRGFREFGIPFNCLYFRQYLTNN